MKSEKLKVVIVDDSALIIERIGKMLGGLKQVEICGTAGNMGAAFNMVEEFMPDVVILDIQLQDESAAGNGITLLTILNVAFPRIKVIMLTNLIGPQYRKKCIKAGAEYFLDKSNEFEKIPQILTQVISEKEELAKK